MLESDILAVLQWWLVLFLLGVGFLPLATLIFSRFFDRGYIFSKLLGIAIVAYVVYLLSFFHLVPFSQISSFMIMLTLSGFCYFLLLKRVKWKQMLQSSWRTWFMVEFLFIITLFSWSYIHSYAPDIHGLEKYMDFGFINSILRTEYFPPKDMWFTPHFINYYYFGHYITALLTKLSGLPSYLTFNIMLSTIFAFCFTEGFSIAGNLYVYMRKNLTISRIKLFFAALLTTILLTFGGNLHILYGFFGHYDTEKPVPFWELPFKPLTFPNSYWYPNATRFIYHTIHEFPIYSWTVADLHGHVLDIPFVLLMISILLAMFKASDPEEKDEPEKNQGILGLLGKIKYFEVHVGFLILLGFLLAIMYGINAWDGGIYLLLSGLVILCIQWQKYTANSTLKFSRLLLPLAGKFLASMLAVISCFILSSWAYNNNFKASQIVSGVGILCAPKALTDIGRIGPFLFEVEHCQHSYWWELFSLYGFFYFFVFCFIIFLTRREPLRSDTFVLLLIIIATLLILIPELAYMKDIYPGHFRANTMFKLVFQSFILLSISSGYIIIRLLTRPEKGKGFLYGIFLPYFLFFPVTLILVVLVLTYPSLAINSYYGNLQNLKSLNGIEYIKQTYPSDFAAIQWLNQQVKGQPVILEAQGDSYTDYARISANTGLPTVLGWTVHEWLWRGSYDVPAPRINEIKILYETKSTEEAKNLLNKYQVKYIFLGHLEKEKYPTLDENKFAQLGRLVFQNAETKIYEVIR